MYALVTGLPEHKIRVISPDIGGGFGNKVPVYPGYVCAIVGSIVTGKPVKWMEDRSENLMSTGFARDYVMKGEIAATARTARSWRSGVDVLADHGAFNATAQPTQLPGRLLQRLHRLLRPRGRALPRARASTRTRRRAGSRTRARSGSPRPSTWSSGWSTASRASSGIDPAELRLHNLLAPEQFPYQTQDRLGLRLRRLRARAAQGAGDRRLRRAARASRPRSASAAS